MRFSKYLPPLPTFRQLFAVVLCVGAVAVMGLALNRWLTNEYELRGFRAAPEGIVFVDKHDLIAAACADLHLYLFSADDGRLLRRIGGHAKRLTSISTFPGADTVATGSADGSIKIWLLPRGIEERSIPAHPGGVLAVCYSQDGSRLASVGVDKEVRVWDPASGQQIAEFKCTGANGCLALNLNGSLVSANGPGKELIVWSVRTGRELQRLRGDGPPTCACFGPDGTQLAVGRNDGDVEIWDCQSWKRLENWSEHGSAITEVSFSSDGRTLYSSSRDRSIGIWDLVNNYRIGTIKGHPKSVLCVTTSETGAIASGGYGPYGKLWIKPSSATR